MVDFCISTYEIDCTNFPNAYDPINHADYGTSGTNNQNEPTALLKMFKKKKTHNNNNKNNP